MACWSRLEISRLRISRASSLKSRTSSTLQLPIFVTSSCSEPWVDGRVKQKRVWSVEGRRRWFKMLQRSRPKWFWSPQWARWWLLAKLVWEIWAIRVSSTVWFKVCRIFRSSAIGLSTASWTRPLQSDTTTVSPCGEEALSTVWMQWVPMWVSTTRRFPCVLNFITFCVSCGAGSGQLWLRMPCSTRFGDLFRIFEDMCSKMHRSCSATWWTGFFFCFFLFFWGVNSFSFVIVIGSLKDKYWIDRSDEEGFFFKKKLMFLWYFFCFISSFF